MLNGKGCAPPQCHICQAGVGFRHFQIQALGGLELRAGQIVALRSSQRDAVVEMRRRVVRIVVNRLTEVILGLCGLASRSQQLGEVPVRTRKIGLQADRVSIGLPGAGPITGFSECSPQIVVGL
jgi:hypothetical protein